MTPLPYVPVSYALETFDKCDGFMLDAFKDTISSTFAVMGIDVPAQVEIAKCTDIPATGSRGLQGASSRHVGLMLDVHIKSDTKDAVDKITKAVGDPVSFAKAYNTSATQVMQSGNFPGFVSPAMDPAKIERGAITTPKGMPIKVLDVTMLDSYPASMFKNPAAQPGEPLPGLAAVDPETGVIGPIKAPQSIGVLPPPPAPVVCGGSINSTTRARRLGGLPTETASTTLASVEGIRTSQELHQPYSSHGSRRRLGYVYTIHNSGANCGSHGKERISSESECNVSDQKERCCNFRCPPPPPSCTSVSPPH
jgi:hypothetical protein